MEHTGNIIRKQRMKRRQIIEIVIYIILLVLIYSLVLIAQHNINKQNGIKLFEYSFYTISSNSMQPEISKGDIIIVKKVKPNEIYENDIITFEANGEIVTHRVQNVYNEAGKIKYITKGDNNETKDPIQIEYEQIIGKKVNTISNIGNIVLFLNNKLSLIFIVLIIILILMKIRRNILKSKLRREKKKIEDKKYNEQ